MSNLMSNMSSDIFYLLRDVILEAIKLNASDIHIQTEKLVKYRVHGQLQKTENGYEFSPSDMEELLHSLMKQAGAINALYDMQERDLSYSMKAREGFFRFRVNASLVKDGIYVVLRHLKEVNPNPLELGVPQKFIDLVNSIPYGIIFIVGPTGSGKSTTLASVISRYSLDTPSNIITIEDPIEYELLEGEESNLAQREVGNHTLSFARGLRAAMREDPDIILVGEVRDQETSSAAIQAAKTGHIVFSTLHVGLVTEIPKRIANMFPIDKQPWVTGELMDCMCGAMAQALVPTIDGKRTLVTEFFDITDTSVRGLVRDGKTKELRDLVRDGKIGWTMNQSLLEKYKQGIIDKNRVLEYSNDQFEAIQLLEKME